MGSEVLASAARGSGACDSTERARGPARLDSSRPGCVGRPPSDARAVPEDVLARRDGVLDRRRRLPPVPPDRLAAPRGRDPRPLRRARIAAGPAGDGATRARRRAAPLPLRLARRASRRRPRSASLLLGALRGGERPGDRGSLRAPRRSGRRAGRDRARLRELDAPVPRDLRAHVLAFLADQHLVVPRLPRGCRARRPAPLGAVGRGDSGGGRHAPLRRARARVPVSLRSRARENTRGDRRSGRRRCSRHPVLVLGPDPRGTVRRRGRGRRGAARRPARDPRVPRTRRRGLHGRVHPGADLRARPRRGRCATAVAAEQVCRRADRPRRSRPLCRPPDGRAR